MKQFPILISFLLITCSLSGQSCENEDSLDDERLNTQDTLWMQQAKSIPSIVIPWRSEFIHIAQLTQ